jgi:anti-sigma regulatory factor (Ser/Thr protein kinase)
MHDDGEIGHDGSMSIRSRASELGENVVALFQGPCDARTASEVRSRIDALTAAEGHLPAEQLQDLRLLATELVSNAFNAGARWVEAGLRLSSQQAELQVHDDAPGLPTPRRATDVETDGRGLAIIDAVAGAWGYRVEHGDGKTVWALVRWESARERLARC